MRTSDAGVALIKRSEGFRARPYLCPAGVPTIGYGHTGGVALDDPPITEEQALCMLRADLVAFEMGVSAALRVRIEQHQFDALVSFAFNAGLGALQSSTLLRRLNAGDFAGAAAEFPRWNKGGGRVLPGLVARRAEERRLFEGRMNAG